MKGIFGFRILTFVWMKKEAESSVLFFHIIFGSRWLKKKDIKGSKECTIEKSLDFVLSFCRFINNSLMLNGFHFVGVFSQFFGELGVLHNFSYK